jgi:predicted XRE-type DNA-binding protein
MKINKVMTKKLLSQTEMAEICGCKRQRIGQILMQGDLLTQIQGKRVMIVNCKFNIDCIMDQCHGTGNWNKPRGSGKY